MKNKQELEAAIADVSKGVEALGAAIAAEVVEAKVAFETLYAKILQLQESPQHAVDYSAEVAVLQASLQKMGEIAAAASGIVETPVVDEATAPTELI